MLKKVLSYLKIGKREFLLEGPAGTGKTYLTKTVAEHLGAEYIFVQAYPGMRFEELRAEFVPDPSAPSGIGLVKGVLVRAVEKSQNGPVVLVIDEFDKTIVSADSYLLDFLQNGRISFREDLLVANKDNLVVFLTSNGFRDFSEPLLRRVVRIKFDHPTTSRVIEMLTENGVEQDVARILAKIHQRTVQRQLRKPATVQELKEFWLAVQAGIPVEDAVRETLIKYEEDEEIVPEIVKLVVQAGLAEEPTEEKTTEETPVEEEATEVTIEEATEATIEEATEATTEEEITAAEEFDQAIDEFVNTEYYEKRLEIKLGKRPTRKYPVLAGVEPWRAPDLAGWFNTLQPTDDANVKVGKYGKEVALVRVEDRVMVAFEDPKDFANFRESFLISNGYWYGGIEVLARIETDKSVAETFVQIGGLTYIIDTPKFKLAATMPKYGDKDITAARVVIDGDQAVIEVAITPAKSYSSAVNIVAALADIVERM